MNGKEDLLFLVIVNRRLMLLYNYIANQETHHHKESFKVEYTNLLEEFGVDYDEAYYFEELI